MSDELKACPLCGSEAKDAWFTEDNNSRVRRVSCSSKACFLHDAELIVPAWQDRPIEAALRAQLVADTTARGLLGVVE